MQHVDREPASHIEHQRQVPVTAGTLHPLRIAEFGNLDQQVLGHVQAGQAGWPEFLGLRVHSISPRASAMNGS